MKFSICSIGGLISLKLAAARSESQLYIQKLDEYTKYIKDNMNEMIGMITEETNRIDHLSSIDDEIRAEILDKLDDIKDKVIEMERKNNRTMTFISMASQPNDPVGYHEASSSNYYGTPSYLRSTSHHEGSSTQYPMTKLSSGYYSTPSYSYSPSQHEVSSTQYPMTKLSSSYYSTPSYSYSPSQHEVSSTQYPMTKLSSSYYGTPSYAYSTSRHEGSSMPKITGRRLTPLSPKTSVPAFPRDIETGESRFERASQFLSPDDD